jgi:hypothetical protein
MGEARKAEEEEVIVNVLLGGRRLIAGRKAKPSPTWRNKQEAESYAEEEATHEVA